MLQRHTLLTVQKQLIQSQTQLQHSLQQLQNVKASNMKPSQFAQILINILSKTQFHIIGSKVIKQELQFLKWSFFPQYQMILQKAELMYIESIMYDLSRIKNQQKITYFQIQDLRQSIDQMNWKLAIDKQSILNQSQQIGQNMDIMKLFEGVRNYQNWQQQLQKKSIQKLISFANKAQNDLTLKKGYQITNIVNKIEKLSLSNLNQLFIIQRKRKIKQKGLTILSKVFKGAMGNRFNEIDQYSKKKHPKQILNAMFLKYLNVKGLSLILPWAKYVKNQNIKCLILKNVVQRLADKQRKIAGKKIFNVFYEKSYRKAAYSYQFISKIIKISQKVGLSALVKGIKINKIQSSKKMFSVFQNILLDQFNHFKQKSEQRYNLKHFVSDKMKGKLLLSLQKYSSNKPINLKKVFLNWYLKGNEKKYSKQIYNIWLSGHISKFTFFMRLKNLVDESRQYKIKYQLKLFLIVLCEKIGKYYDFVQTGYLRKWQRKVKAIKIVQINKKTGKQRLINFINYVQGVNMESKKKILQEFKQYIIKGKEKKIKMCSKAVRKDEIYYQRYFDLWRCQKNLDLIYQSQTEKNKWQQKKQSLLKIITAVKCKNKLNNQLILNSFIKNKNYNQKRGLKIYHNFIGLVAKNRRQVFNQSFFEFARQHKIGNEKKNLLVTTFVHNNSLKESRAINIWRQTALSIYKNDKLQKMKAFYDTLDQIVKRNNFKFLKERYVSKCLNKIISNKTSNMKIMLNTISSVPPRQNWNFRKSLISFVDKISFLANQNKNQLFKNFIRDYHEGKFKKKKTMDIMAFKYFDVTQRYFNKYRSFVKQAKAYERSKKLALIFSDIESTVISSFKNLFMGQAEWVQKTKHIQKLNLRAKSKIIQAFKLWKESAKALTYYNQIKNQKKTRFLQLLTKTFNQNQISQSQKAIKKFRKNYQIKQIQRNFMNRLLDSQIGKTYHVLSIWKSLPPLKNRQLIARACKFEKRLSDLIHKNKKFPLTQYQQYMFKGQQKKRIIIRSLVSQYSVQIKGYLNKWRNNKNLGIVFQKCQRVQRLIKISENIIINDFSLMFKERTQSKIHEIAIDIMIKKWEQAQRKMIMKWFRRANNQKYIDFLKKNSLKNMNYLISKNQKSKKQQKVKQFIKKAKFGLIIYKFLDKHQVKNKKMTLSYAINLIKNIPNLKLFKKYQKNMNQLKKCFIKVKDRMNWDKKQVFEKFRHNRYRGQFKKQKAFSKYLNNAIGQASSVINQWNNLVKQQKKNKKNQAISSNFHVFEQIVRSNFQQLLGNRRQFQIKTKAMERLFRTQQIKMRGFIHLWLNNAKQLKILTELRNKNKTILLEKINKMIENSSSTGAKRVIQNFYHHFRIVNVQRKFVNRLLQTKSGKVMEAFQIWKDIPNQNLMEKYKKGQKFYFKLEGLTKKRVAEVNRVFKNQYDEGNSFKKQSILKIFDATSTDTRKFYARWSLLTKKTKTIQTVKQTMKYFETVEQCNQLQWKLLFEDQRSYQIKVKAIQKLIAASEATTKTYFNIWRSRNQEIKIQQGITKEQKIMAVAFFNKIIGKSEFSQAGKVIEKFRMNFKMKRIAQNFFNRLLNTKTGKMIKLMQKWKSIPDIKFAKKKKNAIIFESRLNKFYLKGLRSCLQPFKDQNYSATNKKRMCIQRLLRLCQSDSRSKFDAWRNINRQQKILKNSKCFQNTFQTCKNVYVDLFKILTEDAHKEIVKKQNICRKMINNSNFVVHHAYFIWKQAHQIDNTTIIKQQNKVKIHLKNLIQVVDNSQNKTAIYAIHQFRNNLGIMQRLKEKKQIQKQNTKAFAFYEKVNSFIIKQTTGSFFKSLKNNIVEQDVIDKVKLAQSCFESFNQTTRNHWAIVLKSNRQAKIMERAIQKIFQNSLYNTQKVFNIWRQNKNILKLQQNIDLQKKKNLLNILTRVVDGNQSKKIPLVIQQFKTNFRIKKLQKQILHKILNTKAGKVPFVFMTWKNLPDPGAKKVKQTAMKFQSGLTRFYRKHLKITFENFRDQSYQANIRKKAAVRKLILVTMSDSNRIFNKWRKITSEMKITNMIKLFDQSSNILTQRVKYSFQLLMNDSKRQLNIKQRSITRIVKSLSTCMNQSLKIWKDSIKQQKIYVVQKAIDNFQPKRFNNKLLRSGFEAIRRRYQIESLRGYINSLWKWKSSNMQANFYSKFIKVFRESQELLNFSNLFNRKFNENLHFSFRRILAQGQQRNDKKKYIVEKYLTKKIRNYFDTFKSNILKSETNMWKYKYSKNIQVNNISQVVSKIFRKGNNVFLKKIQRFINQKNAFENLFQINQNYKLNTLKNSFQFIRQAGYQNFIAKVSKFTQNSRKKCLSQIFIFIKLINKISILEQKLLINSYKYNLRRGFLSLRRESDKVLKKNHSLVLMNQLHKQNQKNKIIKTINNFRQRMIKSQKIQRVEAILHKKHVQLMKCFFKNNNKSKQVQMLLKRFSKGLRLKKILESQDKKLLENYFQRLKVKHNPWIDKSIRLFAAKASLKSSIAVSLWRVKNLT